MKTRIHVNQHNIRANTRDAGDRPVLTVKTWRENRKGQTASVVDEDGRVVCLVVYRPEAPLPCGARVWIETELTVEVDSS